MGFMNRPPGWSGAPHAAGGGWGTASGPYQGSNQFQTFQQNYVDNQAAAEAARQRELQQLMQGGGMQVGGGWGSGNTGGGWGSGGGQHQPTSGWSGWNQPTGGGNGWNTPGGNSGWNQSSGFGSGYQPGQGGQTAQPIIKQMFGTGQGGGSQGYGGWGGLQTNQGWR